MNALGLFSAAALAAIASPVDLRDRAKRRVLELADTAKVVGGDLGSSEDMHSLLQLALEQPCHKTPEWRMHLIGTAARLSSSTDDLEVVKVAWGTFEVPSRFVTNRHQLAA